MKNINLNLFLVAGSAILMFFLGLFIWSFFIDYDSANKINLKRKLTPPSAEYPLGADETGADVLKKLVLGSRTSLTVALSVVFLSLLIGVLYGAISGYAGDKVDQMLMRALDLFYAFPGFLLALAFVAALGPSLKNLILALTVTGWTGFARLVRGEVLHIKEQDFITAAQSMGGSHLRIVVLYILPNLFGVLLVQSTFSLAGTLIVESGLSFLGLGVPAHVPTWGGLLNSGKFYLVEAPHLSFFPGLCIVFLVLGFNLLGDGLKLALDPKKTSVV